MSFLKYAASKFKQLFVIKNKASDVINSYEEMYKWHRYPQFPVVKFALGTLATSIISLGGTYLILKKPIHRYIAKEGSHVAKDIVTSKDVQNSVKNNITELLNEKWFIDLTADKLGIITKELCNNQNVQNDLADMFKKLFQREDIKHGLSEMFS